VSDPSSHHPPVATRTASEASELRSDKDDLTLPQRLTNHGSRAGYPDPDQQWSLPKAAGSPRLGSTRSG
jgi:hypothetical protein